MKELVIASASALISGFFSYVITKSNNKTKIDLLNKELEHQKDVVALEKDKASNELIKIANDHTVDINKLQSLLDLKDKEMESLKLQFDLEDKAKQSDALNPLMIDFFKTMINDPKKFATQLQDIQEISNDFNPTKKLQGHKRKTTRK